MLYETGALESSSLSPIYLTLVPELVALGLLLLIFFLSAYFYNQLAYSGYRIGVVAHNCEQFEDRRLAEQKGQCGDG